MVVKESTFQGANWHEYSEVEFVWLDDTLRGGVLSPEDLQALAERSGIQFDKPESLSGEEIGDILINDVPKDDLLPAVSKLVERYPHLYSQKEYTELYESLISLPPDLLRKLFLRIRSNDLTLAVETSPSEFKPQDIARFILGLHKLN